MNRKRFTKDLKALIFINSLDAKQKNNLFIWAKGQPCNMSVCELEIRAKTKLSKEMIEKIV